jgi:trk system potassium uptake protein TrkA
MRVVVVGAGEVGYHVAERLAKEQHDVVVVDVSADRLGYVESHLDVAVLEGSGASPAVLHRAGVDRAGLLLAVTSVDEVNLVSCLTAERRSGLVKVARVSNPDFYGARDQLRPAAPPRPRSRRSRASGRAWGASGRWSTTATWAPRPTWC